MSVFLDAISIWYILSNISSVIRQKANLKTYAYQGVRIVCFSENLARFVFLKHPFWHSLFCLITNDLSILYTGQFSGASHYLVRFFWVSKHVSRTQKSAILDKAFVDLSTFSTISFHHKWNRTRLLSPEKLLVARQVVKRLQS